MTLLRSRNGRCFSGELSGFAACLIGCATREKHGAALHENGLVFGGELGRAAAGEIIAGNEEGAGDHRQKERGVQTATLHVILLASAHAPIFAEA
jgi:hypothetical protein